VAHLQLAPHSPKSGGKPLKKKRRTQRTSRAGQALPTAAVTLGRSATALGAYYRHIARKKGPDVAVFATARKLGTLAYRLLRWGQNTSTSARRLTKSFTRKPGSEPLPRPPVNSAINCRRPRL